MDKAKRIEAIESAIYEVQSLVANNDEFHVAQGQADIVLALLRRKREKLIEQFDAEWSAYIEARSDNVN